MNRSTVAKTSKPIAAEGPRRSAFLLRCAEMVSVAAFLIPASPSVAFQDMSATGGQVTAPIHYDLETGLLSGTAEAGAEITTILLQIAEAAGANVSLEPGLGTLRNSLSFDGLPVEDALKKLLPGRSFVVVHTGPEEGGPAISDVWVLGSVGSPEDDAPTVLVITPEKPEEETADVPETSPEVLRATGVRDIISLTYKGDAASVAELKKIALKAEDPELRRAAMSALAGISGHDSYWVFRFHGLRDPDPGVRIEAARSLIRTDSHQGVSLVKAAALRERDTDTREILDRLAAGEIVASVSGMSREKLNK